MTPVSNLSDEEIHELARDHGTKHVYINFARAIIALDRARATAEPVGWLIEHSGIIDGIPQGQVSWLLVDGGNEFGYTTDASKALRFATKDSAERILNVYAGKWPNLFRDSFSVTEHMWPVGATVAPSPAPDSQEYILRAMARNYGDGPHQWDKLDRIACERAADEIKSLRAASGASPATADQCVAVRGLLDRWKRDNDYSLIKFIDDIRAALAVGTEIPQKHSDHQVEAPIQLPDVGGAV